MAAAAAAAAAAAVAPDRIRAPPLTEAQAECIDALRAAVDAALADPHHVFYAPPLLPADADAADRAALVQRAQALFARLGTRNFLHRYLRARAFDVEAACLKTLRSLAWHLTARPEALRAAEFEEDARNGKTYLSGPDAHGRPIVVLDSTKPSVLDHEGQLRHLVWTLRRAEHRMAAAGGDCEKFVAFLHLEDFGWSTAPPLRTVQDTTRILGGHFPERLGHCVLYKAPFVFWTLWSMVKPLLDPVTRDKVVMISGDTSEGSANDLLLREIVGPAWRELCGAEQPVLAPGASPGYDHAVRWAEALADDAAMQAPRTDDGAA